MAVWLYSYHVFIRLFSEAVSGVSHLHKHGMIHADFKPANVILVRSSSDGYTAKVIDLGLCVGECRMHAGDCRRRPFSLAGAWGHDRMDRRCDHHVVSVSH